MESSSKLTPETFRGAVGIAPRFKIDLSSADEFFQNNEDPNNTGDAEVAQTYVVLEMIMRAALSDVSIAWARGRNVVRVRTYLFGRMKNGTLVGLRTVSTET